MKTPASHAASAVAALLLTAASGAVIAVLGVGVANYLGLISVLPHVDHGESNTSSDDVTVVFSAAGLLIALITVGAAYWTIDRQQKEGRQQRWMETLLRINERYDQVFDDLFDSIGAKAAELGRELTSESELNPGQIARLYDRYFTIIMTEFRYHQLGLVPDEDFVHWTIILINRIKKGSLSGLDPGGGNKLLDEWVRFHAGLPGQRAKLWEYFTAAAKAAGQSLPPLKNDAEAAAVGAAARKMADRARR